MIRPERSPNSGTVGDRGATLITFALSIVAICAVIALVLGGSLGYDAERNSQTSSDGAALAATSALRNVQTASTTPTLADYDVVYDTAETIAKANGANEGEAIGCELIRADQSTIGDCRSATLADYTAASGVRVGTRDTRDVPFGEVNNISQITGETGAAATIQPLRSGNSPFMVCSSSGGSVGHPTKILEDADPYAIREAAKDQSFMLWANGSDMNHGDRSCGGTSAAWSGWVQNEEDGHELPGWWGTDTGAAAGQAMDRILIDPNGCDVESGDNLHELDGCVIAVPLCTHSNNLSGTNLEFYCVRLGAFELSYHEGHVEAQGNAPCQRGGPPTGDNATKVMCGKFIGPAIATGGQGSDEQAGLNDVVVIKLVE